MALNLLKGFALVQKKSQLVSIERFKSQQVTETRVHIFTLVRLPRVLDYNLHPSAVCALQHRRPGTQALRIYAIDQDYALFAVDLTEPHFDDFAWARLHEATDKLCFDGHLAMAAVNQYAQRNAFRATQIE